ncbi:MAG: polyprenyl synthetase family protein [Pseudomonadota bacterium]
MQQVTETIKRRLESDIALINTLGAYIIRSGGKRMRPLILLLSAKACGSTSTHAVTLAAVIEFIHTATLLHDDVVDASALRRGQPTANDVWGNEASVLVGDFLYSRSFEMMVETGRMEVMNILSSTTNAIAEGEVMQLLNAHSPDTTETVYLETIRRKTAKLFESAAWLGAVVGDQPDEVCAALARYGMHLGSAFQLIDDIMDYVADSNDIGKNVGDDLAEGKPTLPLIYAMRTGESHQSALIRDAIENGSIDKIGDVVRIVESTGALTYTADLAREQSHLAIEALSILDYSEYKQSLIDLAHFAVSRNR